MAILLQEWGPADPEGSVGPANERWAHRGAVFASDDPNEVQNAALMWMKDKAAGHETFVRVWPSVDRRVDEGDYVSHVRFSVCMKRDIPGFGELQCQA